MNCLDHQIDPHEHFSSRKSRIDQSRDLPFNLSVTSDARCIDLSPNETIDGLQSPDTKVYG